MFESHEHHIAFKIAWAQAIFAASLANGAWPSVNDSRISAQHPKSYVWMFLAQPRSSNAPLLGDRVKRNEVTKRVDLLMFCA